MRYGWRSLSTVDIYVTECRSPPGARALPSKHAAAARATANGDEEHT